MYNITTLGRFPAVQFTISYLPNSYPETKRLNYTHEILILYSVSYGYETGLSLPGIGTYFEDMSDNGAEIINFKANLQ
jgi:hypothetical protein